MRWSGTAIDRQPTPSYRPPMRIVLSLAPPPATSLLSSSHWEATPSHCCRHHHSRRRSVCTCYQYHCRLTCPEMRPRWIRVQTITPRAARNMMIGKSFLLLSSPLAWPIVCTRKVATITWSGVFQSGPVSTATAAWGRSSRAEGMWSGRRNKQTIVEADRSSVIFHRIASNFS